MKTIVAIFLIYPAWLCATLAEGEANFLNHVILSLPAEYFADIPLDDRAEMLAVLSAEEKYPRLDYDKHFLVWAVDSKRDQGSVKASCHLAVKLLPRFADRDFPYPYRPFVFVSMDKAEASNSAATENQAFVLMWKRDQWIDVSEEILPENIDRKKHFRVKRDFDAIAVSDYREDSNFQETTQKQLLVWQDDKFELREPFPVPTDCNTDIPFDPAELAALTLTPEQNPRQLMWLIVYAGLEKDERFRYLLNSDELKKDESVALALASYEYALDGSTEALDFIIGVMEREGGGDTNSLLVISYMDEWDRTATIYRNWTGDGAVGDSMYMFMRIREYLYPEKFREHRENFNKPAGKR